MTLRFVYFVATSVLMTGCAAKIIVTRVPVAGADKPMDGIYYALPTTVIKVDQPIDRVSQKPGKYNVYLPLFFPKVAAAGSAIREPKVSFKVSKATLSTYGEPDPEQIFYVKLTKNGPIDRTEMFEYTERGTVSGVSAQADNPTVDIVMSVLNTAAGLGAKAFGAGKLTAEELKECEGRSIYKKITNADSAIDRDRLQTTYCGLPDALRTKLDKAAEKRKPDFDEALAAYKDIYAMQTDRTNLRKNSQTLSLDAALKDFDAAIASGLAENFVGVEKKDTWTYSTELRDVKKPEEKSSLLNVHETAGLCFDTDLPAGDLPPKNFWFEAASYRCNRTKIEEELKKQLEEIKKENPSDTEAVERIEGKIKNIEATLCAAKVLEARFELSPASGQQFQVLRVAAETAEAAGKAERGFFYRIPATADVLLKLGGDTVTKSRQVIAQFGITASLPASTGGRSTAYALKFYEATGALKSFNVTSKAVMGKSTADAIGADITTLVSAKQAANQAQKTKEDELTVLERESKILAHKKAIYDNCKALNLACGGFVPATAAQEQ